MNNNPNPSRPPDLSPAEWQAHVQRVLTTARQFPSCSGVPTNALDHMRDVLLGTEVDERLKHALSALRLLRAARDAGVIMSGRIVDSQDVGRVVRTFDEIVNQAIATVEGAA